jgi:hypothetical protein
VTSPCTCRCIVVKVLWMYCGYPVRLLKEQGLGAGIRCVNYCDMRHSAMSGRSAARSDICRYSTGQHARSHSQNPSLGSIALYALESACAAARTWPAWYSLRRGHASTAATRPLRMRLSNSVIQEVQGCRYQKPTVLPLCPANQRARMMKSDSYRTSDLVQRV